MSKQSRGFPVPLHTLNLPTPAPLMRMKGQMVLAPAGQLEQVPKSKQLCFPVLEPLSTAKVLSSGLRGADRHFPLAVMLLFQQPMFRDELESL